MPVYVVSPRTGIVSGAYERSLEVAVATDADAERLALPFRLAGKYLWTDELPLALEGKAPAGVDGVVIGLRREQLLYGSHTDIRRCLLRTPGCISLVPVHLPGLPGADFISLQPRAYAAGATVERLDLNWRIAGSTELSGESKTAFEQIGRPWARLHMALAREKQQPGSCIDALIQIWQTSGQNPTFASLALRNLIVVLLQRENYAKAEELLALGANAYGDYAEMNYLTGLMWVQRKRPSKAIKYLETALGQRCAGFVGSGGETSYRAQWLLGTIYDFSGDQGRATTCYTAGLNEEPAFELSVSAMLKQRMSPENAVALRIPLCRIARREPKYFESIFRFFLEHRLFEVARVLLGTSSVAEEISQRLQQRLASAEAPFRSGPAPDSTKPGVLLKGPIFVHSGHARINREIGTALLGSANVDASFDLFGVNAILPQLLPQGEILRGGVGRELRRLDLTLRHQWPPDFRAPRTGKLACILPWEYKAVPLRWVEQINANVDELWVPSNFVRSAFLDGGVDPRKVRTVPNGVNINTFAPQGETWRHESFRRFVFLFVGGTIPRKGIDLLLEAYGDAFTPDDDVTLLIKDGGANSYYQHNNCLAQVFEFARRSSSPHTVVMTKPVNDNELAALYRGCNALVLPYRGEGFGMPLVEAMSCGKPVITTAEGPSRDFCSPEDSYLIPATEVEIPDTPPPLGQLSHDFTWFEPDLPALARTLRHVYENREEAIRRGAAAGQRIRLEYNWPTVTNMYLERIASLVGNAALPSQFEEKKAQCLSAIG